MIITIDFRFNQKENVYELFDNFILKYAPEIEEIDYSFKFEKRIVTSFQQIPYDDFDEISITLNQGTIWIQQMQNLLPRICFYQVNKGYYETVLNFVDTHFVEKISYGTVHEALDELLQNTDKLGAWRRKKRLLPDYVNVLPNPIYTNEMEKEIVSIESLPGHSHQMGYDDKLWFGSCWQMYISPVYYKYIPKPLFDDFEDCYEHVVFENGLRKITLYESIEDYDLPENRARQWAFRKQLGIDSIAHELTKANNRIEPLNLPVLITKQNCKVGQTRVTRFLDDNNKLVSSDNAIKKEIKEYLDDGITIVHEEIELM